MIRVYYNNQHIGLTFTLYVGIVIYVTEIRTWTRSSYRTKFATASHMRDGPRTLC